MSYFDEIDKSIILKLNKNIPEDLFEEHYRESIAESKKFKKWFKFHYPFFHNLRHENKFVKDIITAAFYIWMQNSYMGEESSGKYEDYIWLIKSIPEYEKLYYERSQPGLNSIKSFIMYCAFRERHRLRVYEEE